MNAIFIRHLKNHAIGITKSLRKNAIHKWKNVIDKISRGLVRLKPYKSSSSSNSLSFMKPRKKLFCSLFTWIFKHLTRITLFNDASVVHKDHMIGNVACKCHLMGYNDHRRILVGKLADNF